MTDPLAPNPLDARLTGAVGGRTAAAFERALGVATVGDLLQHYPRRYARRGELTALAGLAVGEEVTLVAEVRKVSTRDMRARRGSIVEVEIGDGTGILTLTFFNQKWRAEQLKPGMRGIFAGKVGEYRGLRQLAHPGYQMFDPDDRDAPTITGGDPDAVRAWLEAPVPIYPATSTVPSWKIQNAIEVVLTGLPTLDDPVPDEVRAMRGLLEFHRALRLIHQPETMTDWQRARDALRFHEAFVLQAALLDQRAERRALAAAPRTPGALVTEFEARLPFELTGDQKAVGADVERDLASPEPMNRLIQGEVGSGKTVVALRAMLTVADSGGQSALLAPTEVLAAQHLRSIVRTLGPDLAARLRPTLITGQLGAAERRRATLAAASGGAAIVIGTHALLSDRVTFAELGLVVVDEQHRFGVEQREALRLKGGAPHVLVLTATPIPRTVAMTVFGDLDVSTIAELPAGRSPIASHVVALAEHPGWIDRVWERMSEELAERRQAFVVCPAIDPRDPPDADLGGDASGVDAPGAGAGAGAGAGTQGGGAASDPAPAPVAAVLSTVEQLRGMHVLAGRRIEPLHGRMSSDEKDAVMTSFASGTIDVVVATTVIEVGVDVPNASTMVVLDADRFGMSQLHQLRGRVGRGGVPGLCLFVTAAEAESLARERVEAVASTLDGFQLAEEDLRLRREGDVLSDLQSGGRSSLRLLRVVQDGAIIAEAREHAAALLDADPVLAFHPAIRAAIRRRLDESERAFLAKG